MKLIGKGFTAEVFEFSENKVIKLFYKDYPVKAIRREYKNARLINSYKINAPEVFGIEKIDGRTGIVYSYVEGQSIESAFNSETDFNISLEKFCDLQKSFYDHKNFFLLSYKTYGKLLVAGRVKDPSKALEYIRFINKFPNSNVVVHGDFHPLNVFINQSKNLKVIDFMNVMRAPVKYDVARTFYLIRTVSPAAAEAYLSKMELTLSDIEEYVQLVELYRNLEG